MVERGGRITGYATAPNFWLMNHGVAETETDLMTLLTGSAAATGQPVWAQIDPSKCVAMPAAAELKAAA